MFNNRKIQQFALFFQPYIAGYASSLATEYINENEIANSPMFHRVKSSLTPPWYVFPFIWFILYGLMGYSASRIYLSGDSEYKKSAFLWNQVQIFLNFLWMILYFGLEMPVISFVEIGMLWISIVVMLFFYRKVDKIAFYLSVPYLLWVSFASYLNYMAI